MINLVIGSFLLVLVPVSVGVAWKVAAALSRSLAAASGIEVRRTVPDRPLPRTQPHRYADHVSARSWLSAQASGHRETFSGNGTFRLAGARQARSLQA